MSLSPAAVKVGEFLPEDLAVLYAFWGSRHAEAQTDPVDLKRLPFDQQAALYRQFRSYLDTDQGPLGVYSDRRVGWDSIDKQAGAVRGVGHFLRGRYDA